jgi:4-amino-4-deoxy-L-arabinose transferase-like glycosyltransferase
MTLDPLRRLAGPLLLALAATGATLGTLGPGVGGPGVTCDELYHVATGKSLVTALRHEGLAFFSPRHIAENFNWPADGPPVQSPLGSWILGGTHYLLDPSPDDPAVISLAAARFAPAVAFGLLVLLVGWTGTRWDGPVAGTVASAATFLVPRLFGHAHFAALDMLTALAFTAAALATAQSVRQGGRWWAMGLAGMVWGLALLTRLHGLLLLLPAIAWIVYRLRWRSVLPACVWTLAGMGTLLAGWPWLWLDPWRRWWQYAGTGIHRQAVHVFYAGRVWDDRAVAWHYPLVMFVLALPLGLLVLGGLGIWSQRPRGHRRGDVSPAATQVVEYRFVLGTLLLVLGVFTLPGVPVYDGVRLFLMAFPLWALLAGAGARWLVDHPKLRALPVFPPAAGRLWLLGCFVALQGIGLVVYHPCSLSHYSLLVGGIWGAEKLGFEATYWGDAVDESLLQEVAVRASGERIVFGPNLAPFQAVGVSFASKSLAEARVTIVGWDGSWRAPPPGCRYGVFFHRRADLEQILPALRGGRVVASRSCQGVWLAEVLEFR